MLVRKLWSAGRLISSGGERTKPSFNVAAAPPDAVAERDGLRKVALLVSHFSIQRRSTFVSTNAHDIVCC